ncbi:MAG TPA: phosphotransferase [Rhodanobacteraceae bacterium]|nr:phosphotransferase [Rhodanobacteraceae bacterium]
MTSNPDRKEALRRFVERELAGARIDVASADASFRSYWRATPAAGPSRIVMDAPPDKENIAPWLDIAARLRGAGLHAPEIFAVDREHGFVLMEDLGTRTYLPELDDGTVDALYADALDALHRMQTAVDPADLPSFDEAFITTELELMPEWFLRRHLGYSIECDEWDVIELAFRGLITSARSQPQAFMHRDYHSRNLIVVEANNPGIIDFQGAMIGPVTYDLASLLRDCYIAWDLERVEGWLESYRQRLKHAHLVDTHVDAARFQRWFDLAGLQRHLKVLGIFCRLWYRDGKPQYLADLPLTWHYVVSVARRYEEFAPLADILERALDGRDITLPSAQAA